jgi:hypothetical protein
MDNGTVTIVTAHASVGQEHVTERVPLLMATASAHWAMLIQDVRD